MSARREATELYPETLLTFQDPVTITTQQSQQAFSPVNQADYSGADESLDAPTFGAVESCSVSPPPYYNPPYYYAGYGCYGFYGYGLAVFVGPRVYMSGRGFYRRHR